MPASADRPRAAATAATARSSPARTAAPMKMNTCSTGAWTTAKKFDDVDDPPAPHHLGDGDDRDERRVLVQRDQLRDRRRHHPPQALRQDHVAHRLPVAQAERERRLGLPARRARGCPARMISAMTARVVEHERHAARANTKPDWRPRAASPGRSPPMRRATTSAAPAPGRGSGRSAAGCGTRRPRGPPTNVERAGCATAAPAPAAARRRARTTIAMIAISRLIRKPSRMYRALFPVISHSQLSGSKR